jgi:hypothetical protein
MPYVTYYMLHICFDSAVEAVTAEAWSYVSDTGGNCDVGSTITASLGTGLTWE